MELALLLHDEHVPQGMLHLVEKVLGTSKTYEIKAFDGNFEFCSSAVVFLQSENGIVLPEAAECIDRFAEKLGNMKSALIVLETEADSAQAALKLAQEKWHSVFAVFDSVKILPAFHENRIPGALAKQVVGWKRRLKDVCDMPESDLQKQLETLLKAHNTCTLCTGFGSRVRATPIEYTYDSGALYFLTEGGEKFANLAVNPHVSIAVYQEYTGFGQLESVQIEGTAKSVEVFSEEYVRIISTKGYSVSNLKAMPLRLNMLKVVPERIELLKSDLKKSGHSVKQTFNLKSENS